MKVILIALAGTFVVFFGTTDFGGGRDDNAAIEVGEASIPVQEVNRAFNDQLQDLSMRIGNQVDAQRAIQAGLLDETISQLATRALFDQAAGDLGIVASQETAAGAIRELERFRNAQGRFDRQLFDTFLRSGGRSEAEFVDQVRLDLLRAQYLGTMNDATSLPATLSEALYARRGETRVADVAIVPVKPDTAVADPGEAELAAFFEQNKARFRLPEFRAVTLANLSPETLAGEIGVSDEDVAEAYQARLDQFELPERRAVRQANFDTREAAGRALSLIEGGKDFAEAVEEVSGRAPVDLGEVGRSELFVEALADVAFSTPVDGTGGPVESPLGWHLVHVAEIEAAYTRPLAEVADSLREEIALNRAHDRIFEVLNGVEDALAGGASLEEAASANDLQVQTVEAVAEDGTGPDGTPIDNPLMTQDILGTVFEAEPGDAAEVLETGGGIVAVRVDRATPAREPSLDEVRERAVEVWKQEQRRQAAIDTAEEIAQRVRDGGDLESLAAESGASFRTSEPFDRTGQSGDLPRPLIAPLFAAEVGEIVEVPADDGAAVARLVEIREADFDSEDYESYRQQLRSQMSDDLLIQLANALQRDYPVQVRREVIDRAFALQ